jgi:hypothetical protein
MSLADIEAILEQILVKVLDTNNLVASLENSITDIRDETFGVLSKANQFLDSAQPLVTNLNKIEKSVQRIEDLIYIVLIVMLTMVCIVFLFWLIRHVWPLIRGLHTHQHNIDTVLQDLTTVPGYHHGSSKVVNDYYTKPVMS